MIFDDLITVTKGMQNLQKEKAIKENKDKQENTDIKYKLTVNRTNCLVDVFVYQTEQFGLSINNEVLSLILALLGDLEGCIQEGLASSESVAEAEKKFLELQSLVKKEWAKQYYECTGAAINTLEAIKGIDPEQVNNCLLKIKAAEVWDLNVKNYDKMKQGLEDAKEFITGLGLDDEIITFLQNMNSGRATLEDLNDKVLEWIHNEKLEKRIRVSFVKTS